MLVSVYCHNFNWTGGETNVKLKIKFGNKFSLCLLPTEEYFSSCTLWVVGWLCFISCFVIILCILVSDLVLEVRGILYNKEYVIKGVAGLQEEDLAG